jgi:hypothetical protein
VVLAALFVAALLVTALAPTLTVAGVMLSTLGGGMNAGGQGWRRKGRNADADRQQEEELGQGVHGFDDYFFTIAPAWQRSAASGVRQGYLRQDQLVLRARQVEARLGERGLRFQ